MERTTKIGSCGFLYLFPEKGTLIINKYLF